VDIFMDVRNETGVLLGGQDLNKHNPLYLAHFEILAERRSASSCPALHPCSVMDLDVLAYLMYLRIPTPQYI
jgi:hypothetical protein